MKRNLGVILIHWLRKLRRSRICQIVDLVDRIADVIGKLADYSHVPCPECGNSLRLENNATVGGLQDGARIVATLTF
jgi:hypothetical protein